MRVYITILIHLVGLLLWSAAANAYFYGSYPSDEHCWSGGRNVMDAGTGNGSYCFSTTKGDKTGIVAYGAKTMWASQNSGRGNMASFRGVYAPATGEYYFGVALCPGKNGCTIANSTQRLVSVNTLHLVYNEPLYGSSEKVHGWTPVYRQNEPMSVCVYLILNGVSMKSADPLSCADANPALPTQPAVCTLGTGRLDVTLSPFDLDGGTSGAPETLTVPITCTAGAAITVKTTFDFNPVNIQNRDVVASSTKGVGVSMKYEGKEVTPTSIFQETYGNGTINRSMAFQAIIDPSAQDTIAPGPFTANAVMVMTVQ